MQVLLTASNDERVLVLAKFIRLAFVRLLLSDPSPSYAGMLISSVTAPQKCYCQHNLQTMMQVVHGLAHPDVERLNKTWTRVPSWEMRKLNGMKTFCSHLRNVR